MKTKRNELLVNIIFCSIMAALAIVLDKFLSFPKGNYFLKFTLYGLPLMFVGIMLGKLYGFLSGLVSGIILQLTSEYGISLMSIFWALAPIAWGFFSGLFSDIFKKELNIGKIVLIVGICSISAFLLNTFAMILDSLLYDDSYYTSSVILTQVPSRLASMAILWVGYSIILFPLYKTLKQTMIKRQEKDSNVNDIESEIVKKYHK